MKRFAAFLVVLAVLLPLQSHAQGLSQSYDWKTIMTWRPMWMRGTSASTVAQNRVWSAGGFTGGQTQGFVDSIAFRKIGTLTAYDTSAAFPREHFHYPPQIGAAMGAAVQDSIFPWIVVRVRQDTLSYSWTGATGLDSVRVAIEYSYDGVDWFSCSGTNTYRHDTVFLTTGADGLQSPTLIGVEGTPGEDAVVIPFQCRLSQFKANSFITNVSACVAGNFLRFIVGGDGIGQFKAEYASWKEE